MDINTLMQMLADGEYHSGEDLGVAMGGVSRTAVWKQLKKLEELGLKLESRKGLGYRIDGGLDLLSAQAIRDSMGSAADSLAAISVQTVVDSTNSCAITGVQQGMRHAAVYLAEQQTAGRGRRGKAWISPFASNIYLSLVWQFSGGAAVLGGLSLAVGVAVCRTLRQLGLHNAGLKWPNDVLVDGKKLGGILLEMQGDAAGECQVVIGIGLNVAMGHQVQTGIDQPWTDLQQVLGSALPSRNVIVATLLAELLTILVDFQSKTFAAYRDEWMSYDVYAQREVMLLLGENYIFGTSQGVDDSGALQVLTSEGLKSFNGGEVSLRPAL